MKAPDPISTTFSPALKTLNTDSRGRINIGSVLPDARGGAYRASIDPEGRILLTPAEARANRGEVERG